VIMDEATSNLDSVTEQAIGKVIEKVCEGITTIISRQQPFHRPAVRGWNKH